MIMDYSKDLAFYGVKELAEKYLKQMGIILNLLEKEDKILFEKAIKILTEWGDK